MDKTKFLKSNGWMSRTDVLYNFDKIPPYYSYYSSTWVLTLTWTINTTMHHDSYIITNAIVLIDVPCKESHTVYKLVLHSYLVHRKVNRTSALCYCIHCQYKYRIIFNKLYNILEEILVCLLMISVRNSSLFNSYLILLHFTLADANWFEPYF